MFLDIIQKQQKIEIKNSQINTVSYNKFYCNNV